MQNRKTKTSWIVLVALLGVGLGVVIPAFREKPTQGVEESETFSESAPTRALPVADKVVAPVQVVTPIDCGADYVVMEGSRCRPMNRATNRSYSDSELASFDEMRASPFVANANFLVPAVLTPNDVERRRALFERQNGLADKISARTATVAEIEEYFLFRDTTSEYRFQILSFQHAASGGRISRHDPVLEADEIANPDLKKRYAAIVAERDADYQRHARAREAIGLPGHVYAANEDVSFGDAH